MISVLFHYHVLEAGASVISMYQFDLIRASVCILQSPVYHLDSFILKQTVQIDLNDRFAHLIQYSFISFFFAYRNTLSAKIFIAVFLNV